MNSPTKQYGGTIQYIRPYQSQTQTNDVMFIQLLFPFMFKEKVDFFVK